MKNTKVLVMTCRCASIAGGRSNVASALTDTLEMPTSILSILAVLSLWAVGVQTLMSARAILVVILGHAQTVRTLTPASVSRVTKASGVRSASNWSPAGLILVNPPPVVSTVPALTNATTVAQQVMAASVGEAGRARTVMISHFAVAAANE